jgi:hypothetical protein
LKDFGISPACLACVHPSFACREADGGQGIYEDRINRISPAVAKAMAGQGDLSRITGNFENTKNSSIGTLRLFGRRFQSTDYADLRRWDAEIT